MKLKPRPYALLKLGALLTGISFITLVFVTNLAEFMLLLSYTLGLLFMAYDLFEKFKKEEKKNDRTQTPTYGSN